MDLKTKNNKNMELIKLTSVAGTEALYVNPNHIGHIYQILETREENRVIQARTRVGLTTHKGGFLVKETPEQIIKLITNNLTIQ
jgi:hypothetical protein